MCRASEPSSESDVGKRISGHRGRRPLPPSRHRNRRGRDRSDDSEARGDSFRALYHGRRLEIKSKRPKDRLFRLKIGCLPHDTRGAVRRDAVACSRVRARMSRARCAVLRSRPGEVAQHVGLYLVHRVVAAIEHLESLGGHGGSQDARGSDPVAAVTSLRRSSAETTRFKACGVTNAQRPARRRHAVALAEHAQRDVLLVRDAVGPRDLVRRARRRRSTRYTR